MSKFVQFFRSGLTAGDSYEVTKTLNLPSNLTGPFYVFVITDPPQISPQGLVFEGNNEGNNDDSSDQPLIIELSPPADLQVETITIPGNLETGNPIDVEWTVLNAGPNTAEGTWSDAVYLSSDGIWDIGDRFIGRASFTGILNPGESYTLTSADMEENPLLPPATDGQYRIIVRPDIFDQVYEGENEFNNRTASAETLTVTVPDLQLGVSLETTLNTGQERLYRVEVGINQTLRVSVTSEQEAAANELFLRFNEAPTSSEFDAAYEGFLAPYSQFHW